MQRSLPAIALGVLAVVCVVVGAGAVSQSIEPIQEHREHGASIADVAYDGSSDVVWSLDESGQLVGYDVAEADVVASETFETGHALALGDGVVYVAAADTLWAHDVDAGEATEVGRLDEHASAMAYDDARGVVWIAGGERVLGYDAADGSLVASHAEHAEGPHDVAVAGDHVASSGGFAAEAIVYDVAAETVAFEPDLPDDVTAVDGIHLTGDGEVIVGTDAEGDSPVAMYDIDTGETVAQYREHVFGVPVVEYDDARERIVSAGADNTVTVYDVEAGSVVERYEHEDTVYAGDLDVDGQVLWIGDGEERVGTVVGLDFSGDEAGDGDAAAGSAGGAGGGNGDGADDGDADGSPGFGVAVALGALLAAGGLLAARRRR